MKRLLIVVVITCLPVLGLAAPVTATPVTAAPVTAAPITAGQVTVTPPDPGTAKAVAEWVLNGGETELRALGADFAELEKAASNGDLRAMSTSCKHLQRDVHASQDYDPIPDKQAQAYWASALDQYEQGAKDCIKGADAADSNLLIKASQEIIDGSTDLRKATGRLKELSG